MSVEPPAKHHRCIINRLGHFIASQLAIAAMCEERIIHAKRLTSSILSDESESPDQSEWYFLYERACVYQGMPQRIINSLDELRSFVGQEVGVSEWFTVDQARIDGFGEITEDRQWIHTDTARAKTELPQGKTIAQGFLTLSLIGYLLKKAVLFKVEYKQGINYGFNRVRFPSTVPAGAEIRGRCNLVSVEKVQGGVQICWAITVEVKNVAKPALVAEWLVRYI